MGDQIHKDNLAFWTLLVLKGAIGKAVLGLCAVVVYSQLTITLAVSDGTIVRVITGAFCVELARADGLHGVLDTLP